MFHPSYREYAHKSASDLCKSHSIPTSDNGTGISLSHYPTRASSYRWSQNIPLQSHYPTAWYHGCQEPDAYVQNVNPLYNNLCHFPPLRAVAYLLIDNHYIIAQFLPFFFIECRVYLYEIKKQRHIFITPVFSSFSKIFTKQFF